MLTVLTKPNIPKDQIEKARKELQDLMVNQKKWVVTQQESDKKLAELSKVTIQEKQKLQNIVGFQVDGPVTTKFHNALSTVWRAYNHPEAQPSRLSKIETFEQMFARYAIIRRFIEREHQQLFAAVRPLQQQMTNPLSLSSSGSFKAAGSGSGTPGPTPMHKQLVAHIESAKQQEDTQLSLPFNPLEFMWNESAPDKFRF